jgi:CheY-like chemotaxis protein
MAGRFAGMRDARSRYHGEVPHKLLLADDSVTIQRVIELTFADEDVQVIAVGNGADAIDRAQRDRPDIVLADVGMPERNGYEVAAFIKGTPTLQHIPVVLLTGAFEPVDEARARSVGCDGVLVKPFEPQIVISRVKDLLAGKQPPGMWSGAPVAQGPVRQAPVTAVDLRAPASAPTAASNESLEAYFDHLDAAFGGPAPDAAGAPRPATDPIPLTRRPAAAAGAAARSNDPFVDWDPDLQEDPSRPAAVEAPLVFPTRTAPPAPQLVPPPAVPEPRTTMPAPVAPVAAPAPAPMQIPSLVDAFSALLSAEQKIGLTPSSATVPPLTAASPTDAAPAVTDQLIDDIAARVLARLSAEARPTIHDVAERLVREEIERIKSIG